MRSLERNKRGIHYALWLADAPVYDTDGYDTGEREPIYSDPKPLRINISPAKGSVHQEAFGGLLEYDRSMITSDMTLPLNEQSILWVDQPDTSRPADYKVVGVARGLTAVKYAIKRVSTG